VGLVKFAEPRPSGATDFNQLTTKGSALANASFGKRFGQAKAEALVAAVIARANEVNASPEMPWFIEEIAAFGSWLSQSGDYGDIDLAVGLAERYDTKTSMRLNDELADNTGRSLSFMGRLVFAENVVYRRLKRRDWRISIHPRREPTHLGVPETVIFQSAEVARVDPPCGVQQIAIDLDSDPSNLPEELAGADPANSFTGSSPAGPGRSAASPALAPSPESGLNVACRVRGRSSSRK
jgi:predicted nucleotidyltransferase